MEIHGPTSGLEKTLCFESSFACCTEAVANAEDSPLWVRYVEGLEGRSLGRRASLEGHKRNQDCRSVSLYTYIHVRISVSLSLSVSLILLFKSCPDFQDDLFLNPLFGSFLGLVSVLI